jgi:hypothetical protein
LAAVLAVRRINLKEEGVLPLNLSDLHGFHSLTHFTASYSHDFGRRIAYSSFKLAKLPKTLKYLRLDFSNAPSFFEDHSQGIARGQYHQLHLMFPDLEHLEVHGSWKHINVFFFVNLPRHLQSLRLTGTHAPVQLKDDHLIFLPSNIVHLDLSAIELKTLKPISWPRDLRSLSIVCASGNQATILLGVSNGLEHLKVIGKDRRRSEIPFDLIPPALTSLEMILPVDPVEAIKKLPRSLKKLAFRVNLGQYLTREMAEFLPPMLESISGLDCSEEAVQFLPKTLTHLNPRLIAKRDMLSVLPPGLGSISFGTADVPMSSLPRSITWLELFKFAAEPFVDLPPKLTRLDVSTHISLSTIEVRSLPRTLKMISFSFQPFQSDDAVSELPKNLNSLEWPLTGVGHLSNACLSLLPRSLTSLTIPSTAAQVVDDHWIPDMNCFSEMKHLKIRSISSSLTSNVLTRLPRNLIVLEMALYGIIHQDHLIQLPKSLYRLALSSMQFCGITNNLVSQLPRKLVQLELPSCAYLTSWAAADLPPALTLFEIDGQPVSWLPSAPNYPVN